MCFASGKRRSDHPPVNSSTGQPAVCTGHSNMSRLVALEDGITHSVGERDSGIRPETRLAS
jgi:hypothetical protein